MGYGFSAIRHGRLQVSQTQVRLAPVRGDAAKKMLHAEPALHGRAAPIERQIADGEDAKIIHVLSVLFRRNAHSAVAQTGKALGPGSRALAVSLPRKLPPAPRARQATCPRGKVWPGCSSSPSAEAWRDTTGSLPNRAW